MKFINTFAALITATLIAAVPAFASSINLNSSRSNIYRLDPKDPDAAAACTKAGGSVSTGNNSQKLCTKPKAAAPATGAPRK